MSKPLVSVYLVSYNQEKYIAEGLESVLSQKGNFELEIVVADDASTDTTAQIISEYKRNYPDVIVPLLRAVNVGPNANIIDAISHCKGDFIAHMDGDDLMLPGKIQAQLDVFLRYPDCMMVAHNMNVFEGDNLENAWLYNKFPMKLCRDINDVVRNGAQICNSSNMFRRSCLNDRPPYLPTKVVGDWLFHIQKLRSGNLYYIDTVLGCYRRNSGSLVRKNIDNIELIMQDLLLTVEVANSYPEVAHESIVYAKARVYLERSIRYLEAGNVLKFKSLIAASRELLSLGIKQSVLYYLSFFPRLLTFAVLQYRKIVKAKI